MISPADPSNVTSDDVDPSNLLMMSIPRLRDIDLSDLRHRSYRPRSSQCRISSSSTIPREPKKNIYIPGIHYTLKMISIDAYRACGVDHCLGTYDTIFPKLRFQVFSKTYDVYSIDLRHRSIERTNPPPLQSYDINRSIPRTYGTDRFTPEPKPATSSTYIDRSLELQHQLASRAYNIDRSINRPTN